MTTGDRMALLSGLTGVSALDHFKAINVGETVITLGMSVAAQASQNAVITKKVGAKETVFIVTRKKTEVRKTLAG